MQTHENLAIIKKICKLSKMTKKQLRKENEKAERTYQGKELTKHQLIYQIVYLMDAPADIDPLLMFA